MKTREIALHLARAARQFEFLGLAEPEQLIEVVRGELGHAEALDDFVPYAGHHAMARGSETILHVMSGNTPHAGLQSVIRGLLLGARNFCKIPSSGLPEIAQFRDELPQPLAGRIEIANELRDEWLAQADAVIVFGSDETIAEIRKRVLPPRVFIPHGHKVSIGIVFEDWECVSAAGAARDASLFDQQGCLSPHVFYVGGNAAAYAARLAEEMEKFNAENPRGKLTTPELASIAAVRADYRFRAANDPRIAVFESRGSSDWTVILDADDEFTPSCLNRVIFVKPMPDDLPAALGGASAFLSTIAIWPATLPNVRKVGDLGASRICPIGRMQSPPFTWHQDGGQNLAPLVRWIDAEV